MRKHFAHALSLAIASLLLAGALATAQTSSLNGAGNGAGAGPAAAHGIGSTVGDFTLPDLNGAQQKLSALKGQKGAVLIFISAQCPVVRDYNERIEKLAQDYRARGVNVIGINSNVTESNEDVKRQISENKFSFVVLRDKNAKVADMLGAERTPEAYFIDASNKLVYHGRIDNHRNISLVQANDLRDAIDATLAGKPVVKTEAAAFGCTIKRG